MAPDDEDSEDLYDDEFDFVDDDDDDEDDESDLDDEDDDSELDSDDDSADDSAPEKEAAAEVADSERDAAPAPRAPAAKRESRPAYDEGTETAERDGERDEIIDAADEPADDYSRPQPAANFLVHIYEYQQFKRTIDRPFTAEDAEAFASEYNRTSKSYGRFAVAGKDDAKPRKVLD